VIQRHVAITLNVVTVKFVPSHVVDLEIVSLFVRHIRHQPQHISCQRQVPFLQDIVEISTGHVVKNTLRVPIKDLWIRACAPLKLALELYGVLKIPIVIPDNTAVTALNVHMAQFVPSPVVDLEVVSLFVQQIRHQAQQPPMMYVEISTGRVVNHTLRVPIKDL